MQKVAQQATLKVMEVLVVDPGARGHAIARNIARSSLVERVFVAPGNPGTEEIAENTNIDTMDIEAQLDFVRKQKNIGLVAICADDPLAAGAVDAFEEEFQGRDVKIWGPTKAAAEIEWSKVFSKQLMERKGIPTADFGIMRNMNHAMYYSDVYGTPLFIKMDRLFNGKGVGRADDLEEVEKILRKFRKLGRFDADNPVLIEAESKGPEVSLQAFCDGENFIMVPFAMKDHKTIFDGDMGPMTGGMDVIGPVPGLTSDDIDELGEIFVAPILRELVRQGRPFRGMLYPGLRGWQCLEYNARPGDPEAQIWAALLESDLVEIMLASCEGKLDQLTTLRWRNAAANCLVLAAEGYPDNPKKGAIIRGLNSKFPGDTHILQAGTRREGKNIVVDGGRVLNVVTVGAEGESLRSVIDTSYEAANLIDFAGKQQRHDVGDEVLTTEFIDYINRSRDNGWE